MDKERFPNKKGVEGQKADLTDANLTGAKGLDILVHRQLTDKEGSRYN